MALIGVTGGDSVWPPVTPQQEGPAVKTYDVVINGMATTLQLTDEEAKRRGLVPADEPAAKVAKAPANKARAAANKAQAKA